MDNEKFSVLMSVYQSEKAEFLRRALQSIGPDQVRKPDQIVLVVDGPIGEELNMVIEEFSLDLDGISFDVIRKEQNGGLAAALNTGLAVCKHDLVARMDSDDISLPNRFDLQVDFMSKHPDIAVLSGAITEFEDDENIIIDKRTVPSDHDAIVKMLKTRNAVNHVTVMFRKNVIEKIGAYSENFGKLEDYKLWVDIVVAGFQIHNLMDTLVNVRIGNGFLERRSNKQEISDWDMLQHYLLSVGMISKAKARKNRLYIRCFIYMPKWMKKIVYKTMLRSRGEKNNEAKKDNNLREIRK